MWYAREWCHVWAAGDCSHRIPQAEGGEQGDPLMPAMFSLALQPALRAPQTEVRQGEQALAYLDDIYLSSSARIARLKATKTKVWNSAGILPPAVLAVALTPRSGLVTRHSSWQNVVLLLWVRVPLGTPESVACVQTRPARAAFSTASPRPMTPKLHGSCHKPKARATAYRKELQRGCPQSAFTPHGWRSGAGKESQRGCRSGVATPRQHGPYR